MRRVGTEAVEVVGPFVVLLVGRRLGHLLQIQTCERRLAILLVVAESAAVFAFSQGGVCRGWTSSSV